jgi:hypothetical protein
MNSSTITAKLARQQENAPILNLSGHPLEIKKN